MYRTYREPNYLFSKYDLHLILKNKEQEIVKKVESENDEYISKVNQVEYLNFIENEFRMEAPILLEDQINHESTQTKINVPHMFENRTVSVDGMEIKIFVPFEGDSALFHYRASTYSTAPPIADIRSNQLVFTFEKRISESETVDINKEFTQELNSIKKWLGFVNSDLLEFNQRIRQIAKTALERKLQNYEKFNKLVANIPFPIKRRTDVPDTFVVPQVKRKPNITKPTVDESKLKPEPTLAHEEYDNIMKVCSDMALVMERSPHIFEKIGEEDLRHHFLIQLNGQYEGKATGETFNLGGKNDILIRDDEGQNIFIAECKYWHGEEGYLKTIDQLLGYVTYRDTKTAILIFSRNKNFTDVLEKIQKATIQHNNYVSQDKTYTSPLSGTAFRYNFKNKNDDKKHFLLTVMAFHIPTGEEI